MMQIIQAINKVGLVKALKKMPEYLVRQFINIFLIKKLIQYAEKKISLSNDELFNRFDASKLFQDIPNDEASLNRRRFSHVKSYIVTDQLLPAAWKNIFHAEIVKLENLTEEQIKNGIFYVYFLSDSDAYKVLRRIKDLGGKYIPHLNYSKTNYRYVDRLALHALKNTWSQSRRLSHLNLLTHENICEALSITKDIEGDYVEIGVYLGGSALTALNYLDQVAVVEKGTQATKKAYLLDTYNGFNYEEAFASSDIRWAGTHVLYGVDKTIEYIHNTLSDVNTEYELIVSNICRDDLPSSIIKISVANIDVDMYEPTLDALFKVAPRMSLGGIIICEDPASTPGLYGAYLAMMEFLDSGPGKSFIRVFKGAQYFLIKIS
jgi:hypothetical protein